METKPSSQCITPYKLTEKNGGHLVPCGKCPNCKARRASAWSFRLMEHSKHTISSQFITLTYDTTNVSITRNGFMGLCKRDLQLFFKRLRKSHGSYTDPKHRISYYAVGEYGERTFRPHYHIILFNANIELIQNAWQKGQVHYGHVSEASVGYTLKYISKPKRIPQHINDDREPEFSLMSKGLGKQYLTEKMIAWHKADIEERMYCNIQDGKKIPMPRYYKLKIYSEEEKQKAGSHQAMKMVEQKWEEIRKVGMQKHIDETVSRREGVMRKAKYNQSKSKSKI